MKFVVDASAALKWFLRSPEDEDDSVVALDLLARFADVALRDLLEFESETVADERLYRRAIAL